MRRSGLDSDRSERRHRRQYHLRPAVLIASSRFPLPKPVRDAMLPSRLPESGGVGSKVFSPMDFFSVMVEDRGGFEASVCGTRLPPPLAPRNSG